MPTFEVSPEHHHELLSPQQSPLELQRLALKTQLSTVQQTVENGSFVGKLKNIGRFVAGPAIGTAVGYGLGAFGVPVGSMLGTAFRYGAVPAVSAVAGSVMTGPSTASSQARINQLRGQIGQIEKRISGDDAAAPAKPASDRAHRPRKTPSN